MNRRGENWTEVLVVVLVLLVAVESGCAEPIRPGYGSGAVTAERLTDARLSYHRTDPDLVWSFGEQVFVLEIGGETVPRELIETLTGNRDAVARIEGTWALDQKEQVLHLKTVRADGHIVDHSARLPVSTAGPIRIDLGDYQYNVYPGEAELEQDGPELTFTEEGDDLIVSMSLEIPDAPCVVWTHAEQIMDDDPRLEEPARDPRLARVELSYDVIQCRDDPVVAQRSRQTKTVDVIWRLEDHQKTDVPYEVVRRLRPSAEDLRELARRLTAMAEQSREPVTSGRR